MRIAAFGTYQQDSHPRITVLIEGLRAAGHEVVEINEPLDLSTSQRVSMLKAPWRIVGLLDRLVRRWWTLSRRVREARSTQRFDAVLVGYLGHFDVHLARRLFKGSTLILDHLIFAAGTAIDRGAEPGLMTRALQVLDRRALTAADVIVVDTDEHRDNVPPALRDRVVVCPVGADRRWSVAALGAAPDPEPGEPVRVVFFGLYTPLQGAPTIGAALARLAEDGLTGDDLRVTMIGRGQEYEATRAAAGGDAIDWVEWVEWVDSDRLPDDVAAHHVALGIFGTTAKARAVIPNKVYQSAMAGCAVLTSRTPPQERVLAGTADLVEPGDPAALADALRTLIQDRSLLAERRRAVRRLAEERFTPGGVAAPLDAMLRR